MGKFEMQTMRPIQKSSRGNPNLVCAEDRNNCKIALYKLNEEKIVNGLNRIVINNYDVVEAEKAEEKSFSNNDIPQDMEIMAQQVAGHVIDNTGGVGMLKKGDLVYKPLLKKDCAEREIEIYQHLEKTVDRSLIEMRQLVPKFYGVEKLEIKEREIDFLVLEDLICDFKEPCIMDIKIGRRTWDPNANYEKIISEESKYHECKRDLGFCIPGFQVYKMSSNKLVKYDKEYGKKLDKDSARNALKIFLNAESNSFCRKLLVQFLASLWQIQHFARNQRRLRLYSTSILLVYDARRLREFVDVKKSLKSSNRPSLARHRSLYRPLSLAQLNNNNGCEKISTGFSGQLTPDGPILKSPSNNKFFNLDWPKVVINNNNTWQKSIHTLKRTHSFQNNYDKDVQNRKQNYTYILDDLCCESKSEVWASAKLIDFAHVYLSDSVDVDKNYLDGVENLIKIFEDFLLQTEE